MENDLLKPHIEIFTEDVTRYQFYLGTQDDGFIGTERYFSPDKYSEGSLIAAFLSFDISKLRKYNKVEHIDQISKLRKSIKNESLSAVAIQNKCYIVAREIFEEVATLFGDDSKILGVVVAFFLFMKMREITPNNPVKDIVCIVRTKINSLISLHEKFASLYVNFSIVKDKDAHNEIISAEDSSTHYHGETEKFEIHGLQKMFPCKTLSSAFVKNTATNKMQLAIIINKFEDLLYFDFFQYCCNWRIVLSRCLYCQRLFVQKLGETKPYCTPTTAQGRNCGQIVAKRKYEEAIKNNENLSNWRNLTYRISQDKYRGNIKITSKEQKTAYENFMKKLNEYKKEYENGKITDNDFKKLLHDCEESRKNKKIHF